MVEKRATPEGEQQNLLTCQFFYAEQMFQCLAFANIITCKRKAIFSWYYRYYRSVQSKVHNTDISKPTNVHRWDVDATYIGGTLNTLHGIVDTVWLSMIDFRCANPVKEWFSSRFCDSYVFLPWCRQHAFIWAWWRWSDACLHKRI